MRPKIDCNIEVTFDKGLPRPVKIQGYHSIHLTISQAKKLVNDLHKIVNLAEQQTWTDDYLTKEESFQCK